MSGCARTSVRKNWIGSALVCTVLSILFCIIVALLLPARMLDAADGVSSSLRVLVTKLSRFLSSKENPDVVILGSSLVLTPAVRCDDKAIGKNPCYDHWYYDRYIPEYTKASYFQKLLNEKIGADLSIKNLGVASSIMSDQYGIYKMMLSEGKHPRLLILGLAPRDFLDNTQQRHLETPTRQFMRQYDESALYPQKFSANEFRDTARRIESRLTKVFAGLRRYGTTLACKLSGHDYKVEINANQQGFVGDRPNRLKDLETYRKLYNPPNWSMLERQSGYLQKLLLSARAEGIKVVIVNMPLTRENVAALDAAALKSYEDTLARLSQKCGASFVNIGAQAPEYSLRDFEDSCHLNASGGEKFYSTLLSAIENNQDLLACLNSRTRALAGKVKSTY